MSDFVIIPDSVCELSAEMRQRLDIPVYNQGLLYFPDGHQEYCDLDWNNLSPEEYYTSMKGRNVLYKTSTPPLGEVQNNFERFLKEGKDVLSISLSGGLSSIYSETMLVAKDLMEKYPERKIICVDSRRYGSGTGLLVFLASQKRAEGAGIEETAEYLESIKGCIHQMGSMDDIFFLVKTGRVTNFKAFFGTMIGLNLLADFNPGGMAEVVGKCKGRRSAMDATIEYMKRTIVDPEKQTIFVTHSNQAAAAELLANRIKEEFNPKEIVINHLAMACGATVGPGLCAAFYIGTRNTEGLVDEKALMTDILAEMKNKK